MEFNNTLELEHNLLPVVLQMELFKVQIDEPILKSLEQQLKLLRQNVYDNISIYSNEININSGEQLSKLLFEELQIEPQTNKKTKKGLYPVDKNHLESLKGKHQGKHQIVAEILKYRKIESLLKFCSKLNNINPITKRLHTNFNQNGTATGRFSSSKPNLQNILNPTIKEDTTDELLILESQFRKLFIPAKGCCFIGADYSQIELRITAEYSQDPFLLKAYSQNNTDIHILTASEIFKLPVSQVTDEQRKIAKSINFGLIYGKTEFGLAEDLSRITDKPHTKEDALAIMTDYFNRFDKVKQCLDGLISFADKYGYSQTLWGRKRPIPELASNELRIREKGKRLAMNSPIQGSAADIIKMAMIACKNAVKNKNLKSRLVLQVHDELLFEVPKNEVEIMKQLIREEMESVVSLSVPLKIDLKVGRNWREVH